MQLTGNPRKPLKGFKNVIELRGDSIVLYSQNQDTLLARFIMLSKNVGGLVIY